MRACCVRVRRLVSLAVTAVVLAWPVPAAATPPELEWRACPASSPDEEEFLRAVPLQHDRSPAVVTGSG
ncbi:hypothetical protein DVA67_031690 [Solirubrobacter sp. CPCC 204708]|nr:hypothetical protein [Solirubrobacter deserti]